LSFCFQRCEELRRHHLGRALDHSLTSARNGPTQNAGVFYERRFTVLFEIKIAC